MRSKFLAALAVALVSGCVFDQECRVEGDCAADEVCRDAECVPRHAPSPSDAGSRADGALNQPANDGGLDSDGALNQEPDISMHSPDAAMVPCGDENRAVMSVRDKLTRSEAWFEVNPNDRRVATGGFKDSEGTTWLFSFETTWDRHGRLISLIDTEGGRINIDISYDGDRYQPIDIVWKDQQSRWTPVASEHRLYRIMLSYDPPVAQSFMRDPLGEDDTTKLSVLRDDLDYPTRAVWPGWEDDEEALAITWTYNNCVMPQLQP